MDKMRKLTGSADLTLSEAMQRIDANSCGILFLVNDSNQLMGCLTDGDIRRYLLSGGHLTSLALDAANRHPRCAKTMEEARDNYHFKDFVAIPILDESGIIIDLYCGAMEGPQKKGALSIPVVINAGGKGTRLDPYTRILPKPLIPVGNLPILEHIIREFETYCCEEFHIIVNFKRNLIKAYFTESEKHYNITWHDEEKPLGTGGGLSLLRGKLQNTFFFFNCDSLLVADYESILDFHRTNQNVITMVCACKNLQLPYGVVENGPDGTIREIREKPMLSFLTNTGCYIVEPEVIDDMEDDVPMGFPDIVEMERKKGKKVGVFPVSEHDWMDMGQLPELEKMRARLCGEQ